MPKVRACTPSLIEPVAMVMKTEMADRPLRVRSENSARISAKDLLFAFVGQNKYDYWSNILRINYSHVESQEFNLNLHNTTWRWHATSAKVNAAGARSQRPNS